eukprot:5853955-Pyramimonas_sp.AAC.2
MRRTGPHPTPSVEILPLNTPCKKTIARAATSDVAALLGPALGAMRSAPYSALSSRPKGL